MTWSVSECQRLRFLTYCSFHLRGQCQSFAAHQTGHSQTFNQLTVSRSQCRHPMCIWSAAHPRIKVWVIPLMIRACPSVPFYRPLSEPVYLAACASRRGFVGEPIGWPCEAMRRGVVSGAARCFPCTGWYRVARCPPCVCHPCYI